jgi:hypothetical protein
MNAMAVPGPLFLERRRFFGEAVEGSIQNKALAVSSLNNSGKTGKMIGNETSRGIS